MPERRFSASVEIAREPADVFAWVADHRNVPRALDGITRWEPLGSRTRGRGARFDVAMDVLGVSLHNVLVLDRWEEPGAIEWRSESGLVPQSGEWRFQPAAAGTMVTLTIRYTAPGGVVGGLVAGRLDGPVRARLGRALARMKEILEGEAAAPRPGKRSRP